MKRVVGGLAIATILFLALFAWMYGTPYISMAKRAPSGLWSALSWRSEIYFLKVVGRIPELSWPDLWKMTATETGFGLGEVVKFGLSVQTVLQNPYVTPEDIKAGANIFSNQCATCHGENGKGFHAPPLDRLGYKHGNSILDIYNILTAGIPATAMAPSGLSFVERWQVVGYLRSLSNRTSDEKARTNIRITGGQIEAPANNADKWLTYSGSLKGWRYAPLSEITPANVSQLRLRWVHQFDTKEDKFEATPIVVDGVIFITEPPGSVLALDAMTGEEIWKYQRRMPPDLPLCCGNVNRGLAVFGNLLFFGSLDGFLIALDANTGRLVWQTQVANASDGYSLTGAPLIVKHSVVIGVSGGEFGIRGFLAAYDLTTGQLNWKFDTIPGPRTPGHETWKSDAWRAGGGSTWVTGSYDTAHDLLFWGVGNPSPPYRGDERPGDNLFTDSVIALNATTGTLVWHFQFTPHDEHDWDAGQTPILADLMVNGVNREAICWPNRNGFYYVLDRLTGEFLVGIPFVDQNWSKGLDKAGRPIPLNEGELTDQIVKPGATGAVNWQPNAYDPTRAVIFIQAVENGAVFVKAQNKETKHGNLNTGSGALAVGGPGAKYVRALDAATGARRWERLLTTSEKYDYSGLLATAGGIVFGAYDGKLFALNAISGDELWLASLGGYAFAPPVSFALDGKQVILVTIGRAMFMFSL